MSFAPIRRLIHERRGGGICGSCHDTRGTPGVLDAGNAHDPRVSLVVDDETPPFALVRIDGRAEVSQARDEGRRAAAIEIGRRYGGGDSVDEFVRFADDALGLLVRVRPTHVVALDRVSEY